MAVGAPEAPIPHARVNGGELGPGCPISVADYGPEEQGELDEGEVARLPAMVWIKMPFGPDNPKELRRAPHLKAAIG